MSRDYANRKPKAAAKKPRAKKAAPKRSFPFMTFLIATLLLGGFSYFLWAIKGSSDQMPASKPAPAVVEPKVKRTPPPTEVKEKVKQKAVIKTEPPVDVKATEEVAETVEVAKPDPNALPPMPEEQWTYLEELENKEVEIDIPASEVVSSGIYQMQCGSFRQESQAGEMKARIAFQGVEAQVRRSEGANGIWYRVVLGPYQNKRDAERSRHDMQRSGINTCQIWLWQ